MAKTIYDTMHLMIKKKLFNEFYRVCEWERLHVCTRLFAGVLQLFCLWNASCNFPNQFNQTQLFSAPFHISYPQGVMSSIFLNELWSNHNEQQLRKRHLAFWGRQGSNSLSFLGFIPGFNVFKYFVRKKMYMTKKNSLPQIC